MACGFLCPDALAWTVVSNMEGPGGVVVHCTINRCQPDADFSESIRQFVDDWARGLEQNAARLAALVPKPRVNLTRFHGVFAPNSKHRALVTPAKRGRGNKRHSGREEKTPAERRAAMTWAHQK